MLAIALTTFAGSKNVESSVDLFISKAEANETKCVKGNGIRELESENVEYAHCSSLNNEPSVFFVASGGTQTKILQNNSLGASVMFSRGESQDIIGLIEVPKSLSIYKAFRTLVRVDDQIEYDPQGIGKKVMSLASSKGLEPEGLTWQPPSDFSTCSPENRCLGLKFESEIFSDVTCNSDLKVDLMWLNWANKIESITTATFSMNSDTEQFVQLRANSPKEQTLQILEIRCDS
jgi:hypothetical protein